MAGHSPPCPRPCLPSSARHLHRKIRGCQGKPIAGRQDLFETGCKTLVCGVETNIHKVPLSLNLIINKIYLHGRGRLVQRESVRLRIQRSEFNSRLRQMIFLSRRGKIKTRDSDLSNYSQQKRKRHLLEKIIEKRSLTLSLYEKERTYKLAL